MVPPKGLACVGTHLHRLSRQARREPCGYQVTNKLTSYMDKPTMTPAGLYGFISGMKPCLQLTVPGSLRQPDGAVAAQPSNSTINGLAEHLVSCQHRPFGRLRF